MAPHQHLQWFEQNIEWFEHIGADELGVAVPNCPGWTVESVVNHLSFGLGLGYPVALSKAPDIADDQGFAGLDLPAVNPTGDDALQMFSRNLRSCLATFEATDPERPAWTYGSRGVAGFWFRRAAVETALHRLDVEDALPSRREPISDERLTDGIAETIEFALPLAARIAGEPHSGVTVSVPDLTLRREIGPRPTSAEIEGTGIDVFAALWGRNRTRVRIAGDEDVATEWLSRIEMAFSGR